VKSGGESHRGRRPHVSRTEGRVDVGEEEVEKAAVEVGPVLSEGRRRRCVTAQVDPFEKANF
jgi:hypothetical protein